MYHLSAICNFTNPFSLVDKDHLYSVASGASVSGGGIGCAPC